MRVSYDARQLIFALSRKSKTGCGGRIAVREGADCSCRLRAASIAIAVRLLALPMWSQDSQEFRRVLAV